MTLIIFDLDGTLINSGPLALISYKKVMADYHYTPDKMPSDEQILKTFGLPDDEIWEVLLPKEARADRDKGRRQSGQYMEDLVTNSDILLPHAKEVLEVLHARGYTLTTASNCDEPYLNVVMRTQGIGHLFTHPLCLGSVKGTEKADILKAHQAQFGDAKMVLVGDRDTDKIAAQKVGIPFIGCNFGFGDSDEISGAQAIIDDLRTLLELFPEPESTI